VKLFIFFIIIDYVLTLKPTAQDKCSSFISTVS